MALNIQRNTFNLTGANLTETLAGTTSKTGEDLVLETTTDNAVVIKANNTAVAEFRAANTLQPTLFLSGTGPVVQITGNTSSPSFNIPRFIVTNENKDLFLAVPGSSNPRLGSGTSDVEIIAGYKKVTIGTDGTVKISGTTNEVTLSANAVTTNYVLQFPSGLPAFETPLLLNQAGLLSTRSVFVPRAISNASSAPVTTIQSAGPPQVFPEVVYVATIPANAIGTNGQLKLAMAVRRTNTTNDVYFGMSASTNSNMSTDGSDTRLMGTVGSLPYGQSITGTNLSTYADNYILYANNSSNSIKYRNSTQAGNSGGTYGTATFNTGQTWYLKIWLSSTNVATAAYLESVLVETLYN
jgi:hypothetical protein